MAKVGKTVEVPDGEGGLWRIFGEIDTESRARTIVIYSGSTNAIITSGTASQVNTTVRAITDDPSFQTFIADVTSAVTSMDASLGELAPPVTSDTATAQLTTKQTSPAAATVTGPVSAQEATNIAKNTNPTADNDYGEAIQKSVQTTADDQAGPGKVTVGKVTITDVNAADVPSANPDSANKKPLINLLHNFPSYTYGISLHLLTPKQYNDMVKDQKTYTAEHVLVASAGRYNTNNFKRNKRFDVDFFFDDFNLTTLISPNARSRNTNAIEGSFTLIEPHGFTFMERLILASQELGMKNYLQNPYLLQIDFFAMNDRGEIEEGLDVEVLPPKRIPVKILKVDAKVGPKGAEYKIAIQPYHHSAYDMTTVSIPANFEITASTVAEFFQSIEGTAEDYAALTAQLNAEGGRETTATTPATKNTTPSGLNPVTSRINAAATAVGPRGRGAPPLVVPTPTSTNPTSTTSPANAPKTYAKVTSFGTAINAYQKILRDRGKANTQDVYRFVFDDDIGKSHFVERLRNSPKDTPMAVDPQAKIVMKLATATGQRISTYDSSKAIFQVNAGTTIEKLLDTIIKLCDFTLNQVNNPEDPDYEQKRTENEKRPFLYHKVVPTIELGEFDDKKKVWSRIITYHVKKYEMYNLVSSLGPQGTFQNPVKAYNYIYTGQNDDILDFNIEFNALYFNAVTAYRDNLVDTSNLVGAKIEEGYYQNSPNWSGDGGKMTLGVNTVMPLVSKPVVANPRAQAAGGPVTAKEIAASDLIDTFMVANKADMLNVKLKILGDPDFIKQDDIFYGPNTAAAGAGLSGDDRLVANGSLRTDNRELYVQLLYRTPVDIDETTSLMNFDTQYVMSVFSGLYKVMQIKNNFSRGQFTQELDLVRLSRQTKFDYVNNQNNTTNAERAASAALPDKLGVPGTGSNAIDLPDANAAKESISSAADEAGGNQTPTEDTGDVQTYPLADTPTIEQKDLMDLNMTAPTEAISNNTTPQQTGPAEPQRSPVAASSNSVLSGITASDVQYLRSYSDSLGLRPAVLDGLLTNPVSSYEPEVQAKVLSDAAKIKKILANKK